MKIIIIVAFFISTYSYAKGTSTPILVNTDILNHLNINYDKSLKTFGVIYFEASQKQIEQISHTAHDFNRCGGYELISKKEGPASLVNLAIQEYENKINLMNFSPKEISVNFKPEILSATELLDSDNLTETVTELSAFRTRSSRSTTPNNHVIFMKEKVDAIIAESPLNIISELVQHSRTKQKTLKVRIEGYKNPSEIIILGGHLDSTSRFRQAAPGADDNASGSANILEVFRILSKQKTPERTIELFWYAAEEVGLVGSSEIAKSYKASSIDVVAAMQLDMTGFSGSGTFNIANITDYTSPWLRQTLLELNKHYAGAFVHESKCGYGCSDHASWFRQGYNTVFPIEAKFRESNKKIHSKNDTLDRLNFEHSLVFAKLGLSFIMELANSTDRGPE